ncbi:hypothetical protein BX666DRAFT_2138980 [Dichotomocladium elegans]|nr:hypothetical protein BX666DRAFT_2138980 [Dichotomocladium elegans]
MIPLENRPAATDPRLVPLTSSTGSLETILHHYSQKPELLELILLSKVQEDRRRAEEAKLRSKEIDYILQKEQTQPSPSHHHHHRLSLPSLPSIMDSKLNSPSLTSSSFGSPQSIPEPDRYYPREPSTENHGLTREKQHHRNGSNSFSSQQQQQHPLLSQQITQQDQQRSTPSHTVVGQQYQPQHQEARSAPLLPSLMDNCPPGPITTYHGKRRRREMQAITMVIETREFPYNDDYLWKNNGNTIHKGSGNRSIYYKCANNAKGCPVNKTVTFKDNGEYLIKYRGKHIDNCSRIKRVVDI